MTLTRRCPVGAARRTFPSSVARNVALADLATAPFAIDFKAATRAEAAKTSCGPCGWQRRQQPHDASVALQQHLGKARRTAEVAIDLERRVLFDAAYVEEIVARRLSNQLQDVGIRCVAILEPRVAVDDPRAAPAGAAASVIEPPFEAGSRGVRQLRCTARRDLIVWIQRPQMRDVPMPGLGFSVVLVPLLQHSGLTYFERRQTLGCGDNLLSQLRIDAE